MRECGWRTIVPAVSDCCQAESIIHLRLKQRPSASPYQRRLAEPQALLPLQPQMVTSIGAIGQFRGFHEMITGQVSLPWPFGLPHRIERYAFQAGGRGFESLLPLQSRSTPVPTLRCANDSVPSTLDWPQLTPTITILLSEQPEVPASEHAPAHSRTAGLLSPRSTPRLEDP